MKVLRQSEPGWRTRYPRGLLRQVNTHHYTERHSHNECYQYDSERANEGVGDTASRFAYCGRGLREELPVDRAGSLQQKEDKQVH